MDKIYTVKEVADLLVVTPITVRRWIHKEQLLATKQGNVFTVTEEALMNFAFRRYKYAMLLCANIGPRMALMYSLWRNQVSMVIRLKQMISKHNYDTRKEKLKEAIKQLKREED